ncbi:MAG: 50S ribosomal protein L31e [Thermoproteota archaeon]|jgi:large subunit ribosomal protein L31e|nr:50S ribosomal protein L31e [Thermoproteota archaeon]
MSEEKEVRKGEIKEEVKEETTEEKFKIEDFLYEDESIKEERIMTINLRDAKKAPLYKRSKKAVKLLKELVKRFTKQKEIWISQEVNEAIWKRGIKKPPRKIKVKIIITNKDRALVFSA